MPISLTTSAVNDLKNGYQFYESQVPSLGSYFLDSLYSDIDSLILYAGIHQKVFDYHRLLSKRFPYAIYYKIIKTTVIIWRVLDCRQNPVEINKNI